MKQKAGLLKKIIRTTILVGFFWVLIFVGRNQWNEFSAIPANERYIDPRYKKVVSLGRKVLGALPFAAGHYALANSYLDEGAESLAVDEYKKTLQIDAHFTDASVALAEIYLRRGHPTEALALLEKAEKLHPGNPDIKDLKKDASYVYFLESGVSSFEKGDEVKARELLNKGLAANPDSAHLHYLIALSFREEQDFYRVEDHLKTAIRLDPKYCAARSFLGDLYFGQGDFEAALQQYKDSLSICGDNSFVLNNMGLAYMNLERYGQAIPLLERSLVLNPANVETLHNLTNLYRDHGHADKAIEGYLRLIQLKPDDLNIYNDLGDIYRGKGQVEAASQQYRVAIARGQRMLYKRRNPPLLVAVAHAYNGIQDFQMAKKMLDESLIKGYDDPKAYMTLANTYRGLGRFDAALIALDKAKKLTPNNSSYIDTAIAQSRQDFERFQKR
ncbi:MAG: tetratricopeptide repeat protein [Candidatus Omnitrophota bacterium]